jgi:hypothetical protein
MEDGQERTPGNSAGMMDASKTKDGKITRTFWCVSIWLERHIRILS